MCNEIGDDGKGHVVYHLVANAGPLAHGEGLEMCWFFEFS